MTLEHPPEDRIRSRRIALFCEMNTIGGVDTFIHTLVNAWPIKDDQFTVLCNRDYPGLVRLRDRLATPHTLVSHRFNRLSAYSKKTLENTSNGLRRKLLVYFFILARYSNFLFLVIRIKKTLIRGNFDRIVVVNGGYPGGDTCRAASIAWGKIGNSSIGIHSFHNFASESPRYVRCIENLIDRSVQDSDAMFVSVSGSCLESLKNRNSFRRLRQSRLIYNGTKRPRAVTSIEVDEFRRRYGISRNQPLLVMLATYEERKGHEFLFDVLRVVLQQRNDCRLLVCGDGTDVELERVRQMLRIGGLERFVQLLQFQQDACLVISAADVVVVPSQREESFGLVIVEAMAAGKPVVATAVGGIPEVLENGIGGYLCGNSDVECFASKILSIINDSELAARIGESGILRFEEKFSANSMALQYAELLK